MTAAAASVDSCIDAIDGAAAAGSRLGLVLTLAHLKLHAADTELHHITKSVSDFALILKQVARSMRYDDEIELSQLAVDTVADITLHGEHIFDEIKGMTGMAQKHDDQGKLAEVDLQSTLTGTATKPKLQYLLGQLDYLRLSLTIMLQIFQLGQEKALDKHPPTVQQEYMRKADVTNMIVLQHWSLERLQNLYTAANQELKREEELKERRRLARRDSNVSAGSGDSTAAAAAAESGAAGASGTPGKEPIRLPLTESAAAQIQTGGGGLSQALVPYREQPLQHLDDSLQRATAKENLALNAQVHDIVDHLLDEWILPLSDDEHTSRGLLTQGKYRTAHFSDARDSESTSASDMYDETHDHHRPRGTMLEGPAGGRYSRKKSGRWRDRQAQVEDATSDGDGTRRPQRVSKHHVLRSDVSSSSSSSSEGDSAPSHAGSQRAGPVPIPGQPLGKSSKSRSSRDSHRRDHHHQKSSRRRHRRDGGDSSDTSTTDSDSASPKLSHSSLDRHRRPYASSAPYIAGSPPEKETATRVGAAASGAAASGPSAAPAARPGAPLPNKSAAGGVPYSPRAAPVGSVPQQQPGSYAPRHQHRPLPGPPQHQSSSYVPQQARPGMQGPHRSSNTNTSTVKPGLPPQGQGQGQGLQGQGQGQGQHHRPSYIPPPQQGQGQGPHYPHAHHGQGHTAKNHHPRRHHGGALTTAAGAGVGAGSVGGAASFGGGSVGAAGGAAGAGGAGSGGGGGGGARRQEKAREREVATRSNLTKGIGLGAAMATVMELLSGLEGI